MHSFVVDRLNQVRQEWILPPPFTYSNVDVDTIVKKAGPLFIFASTVCKFIAQSPSHTSPQDRLRNITSTAASGDVTGQKALDELYTRIFSDAFSGEDDTNTQSAKGDLRDVVGFILLLSQPLGLADLAELLGGSHTPASVRRLLVHMHSVIAVPEDDFTPIRAFHASFQDYVTTKGRAHPNFYVDPVAHHVKLAARCFEILEQYLIKNNICDLPVNVEYAEIRELVEERRKEHIPGVLEYASRHWVDHLVLSQVASDLLSSLQSFVFERLLRWIDLVSILRYLDGVVPVVNRARRLLLVSWTAGIFPFGLTQTLS